MPQGHASPSSLVMAILVNRRAPWAMAFDTAHLSAQIVAPILADGEIIGGLMLLSRETGTSMSDVDRKVAETTANIVGKQMEQ